VNWAGDSSEQGLQRALGLTANYVYRLKDVERNHELFATERRVVASPAIERLAAY
jgi:malonyl-CoA decarboxylase